MEKELLQSPLYQETLMAMQTEVKLLIHQKSAQQGFGSARVREAVPHQVATKVQPGAQPDYSPPPVARAAI